MYGTLGYIDNGRRPPQRDAHFMGASNHPARRDMYGARRPEHVAASVSANTVALLERRCIFLEEQEKRCAAEIADLRAKLADARVENVTATVLEPTVQTVDLGEDHAMPTAGSGHEMSTVAAGTELQLQYPMKRVRAAGGATQVWMRRREVDPHIASVSYSWVLLFEEQDGRPDRVLVGHFR